jgi:hypothetical protein
MAIPRFLQRDEAHIAKVKRGINIKIFEASARQHAGVVLAEGYSG